MPSGIYTISMSAYKGVPECRLELCNMIAKAISEDICSKFISKFYVDWLRDMFSVVLKFLVSKHLIIMYQILSHSVSINRVTENNVKLIHVSKENICSVLRVARRPGLTSEIYFDQPKYKFTNCYLKEKH